MVVITFIVYIPLILYFSYPLYKYRDELIFKKRHIKLSLFAIMLLIIGILISNSSLIWAYLTLKIPSEEGFDNLGVKITGFILTVLIYIDILAFYSTMFVRLYLTYYNIQYQINDCGSNWKNVIDKSHRVNVEKSWFISNKHRWGNEKFWGKLLFIGYFIVISLIIFTGSIDLKYDTEYTFYLSAGVIFSDVLTFVILTLMVYYRLKKLTFHDDFHIVDEFYMFIKGMIVFFVVSITYSIASGIILPFLDQSQLGTFVIINWLITYEFYAIFAVTTSYIMSRYVLNQLRDDCALQKQYGRILNRDGNNRKRDEIKTASMPKLNINLQRIMNKGEYLDVFMCHLAQEFSLECALSLIEFLQFKRYLENMQEMQPIQEIIDDDGQTHTLTDTYIPDDDEEVEVVARTSSKMLEFTLMTLTKDIPQSTIVYDSEHNNKWKAEMLFRKYIMIGAEYEINVNSRVRDELTSMFAKRIIQASGRFSLTGSRQKSRSNDVDKDYSGRGGGGGGSHNSDNNINMEEQQDFQISSKIFDRCIDEMGKLLGYSLSRFKLKAEYVKLLNFEKENADFQE